jgi:MoxR-like ATPase
VDGKGTGLISAAILAVQSKITSIQKGMPQDAFRDSSVRHCLRLRHSPALMSNFRPLFSALKTEMQKAIVGYDEMLTDVLVAVFSGGHVLLEGVPGLGKTFLVRTLSQVIGLEPGRVQCTPDLMPADILGTHIVDEDERGRRMLRYEKGPVFKNLLLVDEINRATPKTQAALLEVMQERCVTTGGERHLLPEPFLVLATQNPMEMEGTYPLPEAQLDRFMFKITVDYPSLADEVRIATSTTSRQSVALEPVLTAEHILKIQDVVRDVLVAEPVAMYAVRLSRATRPTDATCPTDARRWLSWGAGPRACQALLLGGKARALLDGRPNVSFADVRAVAKPVLRHRVVANFTAESEGISADTIIERILEAVPEAD